MEKIIQKFRVEFIARIIGAISGALVTIILARLLRANSYGLLFLSISILSVATLFAKLGIARSAARFINSLKTEDPKKIRSILKFALIISMTSTIIVGFLIFIFTDIAVKMMNETGLKIFLYIGPVFVLSSVILQYTRKCLQGLEEIEKSSIVYIINHILRLLFAVGIALVGYGALGAFIGFILANIVAGSLGLVYLFRTTTDLAGTRIGREIKIRIIKYSFPLTATNAANIIDKQIDTILVGILLNPIAVGYYTIGRQIVNFIEVPASAIGFTLSPAYESVKKRDGSGTAGSLYQQTLINSLIFYIPASAGVIITAEIVIEYLLGQEYLAATTVVQILSVFIVFDAIVRITGNGLDFLGKAKIRAYLKGATSALNFLLNIILIPIIGVEGAAIATVITHTIYAASNIFVMDTELVLDRTEIFHSLIKIFIITLIMSIPTYYILSEFKNMFGLIFAVGTGISIWLILSLYFDLIDKKDILSLLS